MKTYRVNLIRGYDVLIKTENEEKAKRLTEYFIGNPKDISKEIDRIDFNFNIAIVFKK